MVIFPFTCDESKGTAHNDLSELLMDAKLAQIGFIKEGLLHKF